MRETEERKMENEEMLNSAAKMEQARRRMAAADAQWHETKNRATELRDAKERAFTSACAGRHTDGALEGWFEYLTANEVWKRADREFLKAVEEWKSAKTELKQLEDKG
jgi:hypothetical protein